MKIQINTKFDIGDSVYHITPESDKGIILDIQYFVYTNTIRYYVTFGRAADAYDWYDESELSTSKVF